MARVSLGLAALAMCAVVSGAAAQQRVDTLPIDTDRPDFTDATTTIAPGRFQLETGYTYRRGAGDFDHSHSFPEALLRIGITSSLELRLGQNFLSVHPDAPLADGVSGLDDLYLGTKFRLADQHGIKPAVSMEAFTTVPTGSDAISAHTMLPGIALLAGWQISGPVSLGAELAGSRTADNYLQAAGSVSAQLAVTSKLQGYLEWFTLQPVRPPTGVIAAPENYADTGLMYLLSRTVQVDARVVVGLTDTSDKYAVGFGFSIRR